MASSNFRFGKGGYYGRTDGADRADPNGFFGLKCSNFKQKSQKKSVRIRPICSIRSPIVSPFSKAEIAAWLRPSCVADTFENIRF
jgi:hypothetical protein